MRKLQQKEADDIEGLKCDITTTVVGIDNNRRLVEWKGYVDIIFNYVISGRGSDGGYVSPILITKEHIIIKQKLIKQKLIFIAIQSQN